jgi:hypothetical protein
VTCKGIASAAINVAAGGTRTSLTTAAQSSPNSDDDQTHAAIGVAS